MDVFFDDLLEKYITIWDKVGADIKKKLTTSLSHGDEVTDFYGKKLLRWTLIILV